jgi:TetR/AcrR family acrAB operon transcriptional repressor
MNVKVDHKMARKSKQDALETRNRLLDAAEQVFFEKGFAHTTLMDIATAADLTRGAIYWHFKNKSEVFEAMVERVHLPMESLAESCPDDQELDPLARLREFAIRVLKETARNPRRRRVFTILFHKFEFNGEAKSLELRQQAAFMDSAQRVEQTLENAVAKGLLPADLDIHKATIANHAFFTGLISNWLFLPRAFDLEANAEAMVDSYFAMLMHSPAMRKDSSL